MAVGFQRRNVGLLADVNTGAGTEAFRDFTQNPIATAMNIEADTSVPGAVAAGNASPKAAPAQGSVSPAVAGPQAIDAWYAGQVAAAEKAKAAAKNPLNVVLGGLAGVVGAPFKFLDAAIGGGDVQDITAPFRPGQAAQERFDNTMNALNLQKANALEAWKNTQTNAAQALTTAAKSRQEVEGTMYNRLANLALRATSDTQDPRAQEQFFNYSLSTFSDADKQLLDQMGLSGLSWSPRTASYLIARAGDKNITEAYQAATQGEFKTLGPQEALLKINPDGTTSQTFLGDKNAPPNFRRSLFGYDPNLPGGPTGPSAEEIMKRAQTTGRISVGELNTVQQQLQLGPNGAAQMGAWLKDNNIVVEQQPTAPVAPGAIPPPPPGFVVEQ